MSRTLKEESCRRPLYRRSCARDGGLLALQRRPTGAGAKPPDAALAEDRRGERSGKGAVVIASGGDQEDVPEALGRGDLVGRALLRRRNSEMASKPGVLASPSGSAWRIPVCWPGGARRRGGVSLVCGFCAERWRACPDTAACCPVGSRRREGDLQAGEPREGEYRGRGARSERLIVVMIPCLARWVAERRGRLVRGSFIWSTGVFPWEESRGWAEIIGQAV